MTWDHEHDWAIDPDDRSEGLYCRICGVTEAELDGAWDEICRCGQICQCGRM